MYLTRLGAASIGGYLSTTSSSFGKILVARMFHCYRQQKGRLASQMSASALMSVTLGSLQTAAGMDPVSMFSCKRRNTAINKNKTSQRAREPLNYQPICRVTRTDTCPFDTVNHNDNNNMADPHTYRDYLDCQYFPVWSPLTR